MRTRTRDTSEYGLAYISGLLRMESARNIAEVARQTGVPEQNMQQFISDSPWSSRTLISAIQDDIGFHPVFATDSVLLVDESSNEKSGGHSAGASRHYNGRLGKIEMSQTGVFLSLCNKSYHTWVDGELYVPKKWFSDEYAARRKKAGIPTDQKFATKIELAWSAIERVYENSILFCAVDCDSVYGRAGWFRDKLAGKQLEYYGDIPSDTQLYRSKQMITLENYTTAAQIKKSIGEDWETITLRPSERGMLTAQFAVVPVWTVRDDGTVRAEQLLMRKDKDKVTYSLTNADKTTPLSVMAGRKSQRYLIERSNQEMKSQLGWDDFQALKYRAWEHNLALTIMASWFVLETRLDWAEQYKRDPQLLEKYETDVLPMLSVANIRELLRAAMPLPQLTTQEASQLVVKHLINRTRSRKSRLKNAKKGQSP